MVKQDVGGPRAKFCRERQFSPSVCDPRSFRTKPVSKKTKLVVCCPKGKFDRKTKRCKVGTKTQSILKKKVKGKCPTR